MMLWLPRRISSFGNDILVKFVPDSISKNYRRPDDFGQETLTASLLHNYVPSAFPGLRLDEGGQSTAEVEAGLPEQLMGRVTFARTFIIPWLNDCLPLDGANILEISCGTGSFTVAPSEQGARVVGIDNDEQSLVVARDRCSLYGLDVKSVKCCSTEVDKSFAFASFDMVLMSASASQPDPGYFSLNEQVQYNTVRSA